MLIHEEFYLLERTMNHDHAKKQGHCMPGIAGYLSIIALGSGT
jgi:hypothetical protein